MTFKLFDYQKRLVDEARTHIANGHKGVLIQSPPGSGKSVVIAEIVKQASLKGNHTLFLVHRIELATQIEETFVTHGVNMNYVSILSPQRARNRIGKIPDPKIIVTDETHHSRAKSYLDVYDAYPEAVHLGFTATPWRMNRKGFTDIFDKLVLGESVEWLIENKNLAPYIYKSVNLIERKKLKKASTGDYNKKSIDDALGKYIFGDVVKNYQTHADGEQAILYAHSIEASIKFAEEFRANGITAEHADSKTPAALRERIMNDFKTGKTKVICNVDLISEGFNVPDCSTVIQCRPTESLVLFMQQSMRGMRYRPNKVSMILDHVGNYARHGLPDTEHDWEVHFNGREKKCGELHEVESITVCESCFVAFSRKVHGSVCPECGHDNAENEEKEKSLLKEDAELVDITQESFKADYLLINYAKKDKKELKTFEDAVLFCIAREYKTSWIKFNSNARDMSWQVFNSEVNKVINKYPQYKNLMKR